MAVASCGQPRPFGQPHACGTSTIHVCACICVRESSKARIDYRALVRVSSIRELFVFRRVRRTAVRRSSVRWCRCICLLSAVGSNRIISIFVIKTKLAKHACDFRASAGTIVSRVHSRGIAVGRCSLWLRSAPALGAALSS